MPRSGLSDCHGAGGRLSLASGGKPTMLGLSEPLLLSNGLIHNELAGMFRGV